MWQVDSDLFKLLVKGEEPAGPIWHKWGQSSSLSTVLCEFSAYLFSKKSLSYEHGCGKNNGHTFTSKDT